MADEIVSKIGENALGPKRVRGDSGEIEQHPIKDQIEADRYTRSRSAMKKGLGFTLRKFSAGDGS